MSDKTSIEWTDHTFNPWWGCSRVSPACRFCYADRDATRYGHQLWRRHGERRMLSEANWARPLKWNRDAERAGVPAKVFCASMADVFEDHPDVADPRERLWDLIEATPWLVWQLLTKRPENIGRMAPWGKDGREWPANVWAGTSAESQQWADVRLDLLVKHARGARVLFVSAEPMLGPLDLSRWLLPEADGCNCGAGPSGHYGAHERHCGLEQPLIDWIICGGESGPKARPTHPQWFRSLRDLCQSSGVPFLFKQHGEWSERGNPDWPLGDAWKNPQRHCWVSPDTGKVKPFGAFTGTDDMGWAHVKKAGKKVAGRELDGRTWDQFPSLAETGAA